MLEITKKDIRRFQFLSPMGFVAVFYNETIWKDSFIVEITLKIAFPIILAETIIKLSF